MVFYNDAASKVSDWSVDAMLWAVENDIYAHNTKLIPKENASCTTFAEVIYGLLEIA